MTQQWTCFVNPRNAKHLWQCRNLLRITYIIEHTRQARGLCRIEGAIPSNAYCWRHMYVWIKSVREHFYIECSSLQIGSLLICWNIYTKECHRVIINSNTYGNRKMILLQSILRPIQRTQIFFRTSVPEASGRYPELLTGMYPHCFVANPRVRSLSTGPVTCLIYEGWRLRTPE
jgi:hypothetical protein